MKKAFIILSLLALSMTLYGTYEAYAAINITPTTPSTNPSATPSNNWNTPNKPNPRTYGDPINDPRPKSRAYPIPV